MQITNEKSINGDIDVRDLTINFFTGGKEVNAVKDVRICFHEKRITGLIGESGSGKSVLGMSILQLLPNTARVEGNCIYKGRDIYRMTEDEICNLRYKEISLIPQNPLLSLNPVLKIKRQLTEPLTLHLEMKKKEAFEYACKSLSRFSFQAPEKPMNQYSFQMSGGMNQRIVSCMGLECSPHWVIADEPTKGLDAILRRQVYQILKDARENGSESMILITHDLNLAEKLCDDLAVLYQGQIVEQGKREDIMTAPKHPYTTGLMNSIPSRGMKPIPLPLKERNSHDSGCRFYSRCGNAEKCCLTPVIPEVKLGEDRIVRCARYA